MIAICNASGGFLYHCTVQEADERIQETLRRKEQLKTGDYYLRSSNGCLDYDGAGNMRKEGGMFCWIFPTKHLIKDLMQMGCEAVYICTDDTYTKYRMEEFDILDEAYQKVFEKNLNEENTEHD